MAKPRFCGLCSPRSLTPLAEQTGSQPRAWYLRDTLGSTHQTFGDSGALLPSPTVRYDPFGAVRAGTPPDHGFTGENWDAATGLVNLRARWYDPAHGTFTSRDPFGGWASSPASQHPYQYAANSPMQYTDPSGKCIGVLGGADTLFCAMVVSAVIGGVINYGTQVYQNYQGGYRGWGTFTHVCIDELLISMAGGAVGGFVGYALGPLTAVLTKSGLLGSIIAGAFEGGVSGGFTQIGGNLLSGKAWDTDLASATIGGGIGGGVGGGLGWAARGVAGMSGLLHSRIRLDGGTPSTGIPAFDQPAVESPAFSRWVNNLQSRNFKVILDPLEKDFGTVNPLTREVVLNPNKARYIDLLHESRHVRQVEKMLEQGIQYNEKQMEAWFERGAYEYEKRVGSARGFSKEYMNFLDRRIEDVWTWNKQGGRAYTYKEGLKELLDTLWR